jgi:DNA-3-methyladenine glycosylase I
MPSTRRPGKRRGDTGAREIPVKRCGWAGSDPLYVSYHDSEWGKPVHDDRRLFEMLVLEGAQAGLSWSTILKKRKNYQKAFHGFNIKKVASYSKADVKRLLGDPGIVRNRLKIESAIRNARGVLEIKREFGSFDSFIWRYVDYTPRQNSWRSLSELPARTEESDAMSKDLKKHGFSFVGSTICYAFMQAVGMVNDHVVNCFRHKELAKGAKQRKRTAHHR